MNGWLITKLGQTTGDFVAFVWFIVALWRYMVKSIWVNIGSGYGSTKTSTKPIPTKNYCHQSNGNSTDHVQDMLPKIVI